MIRVRAPSRLHLGLLNAGDVQPQLKFVEQRFGGVGVMIEDPGVEIDIEPASSWKATGPLADRALEFARRFAETIKPYSLDPHFIAVRKSAPEHAGLGTGTQLGLAVAKALAVTVPESAWDAPELARRIGRGLRSAIGIHGFDRGGFIYDGGKWFASEIAGLREQLDLPEHWRIVVARPVDVVGIHGGDEMAAFAKLPADRKSRFVALSQIVEVEMIPALRAGDCKKFGEAVHKCNRLAGEPFAPAQGGPYACALTADIVAFLRSRGISGVGQSSWGPTVFAIVEDESRANDAVKLLEQRFGREIETIITRPSRGHVVTRCSSSSNSPVSS
jgi:beta-ribofuranosylaminobenzene 5'-phosphate synthase